MTGTEVRDLLAACVRQDVRLRLGPNAQQIAVGGEPVMLSGGEADDIATVALAALRDFGMVVVPAGDVRTVETTQEKRAGHDAPPAR